MLSAGDGAGSGSGGACGGNSHELGDGFVGGQVLVGIELCGDAVSLAGWASRGTQHPSTTSNRDVFRQGDFRWHGKSQLDDRSLGERCLSIKENSTTTQILNKSGYSPSIEVNRQWLVHFETLRTPALQTIRIRAHGSSFSISGQLTSTLSWIEAPEKLQVGYIAGLWKFAPKVNTTERRPPAIVRFADWRIPPAPLYILGPVAVILNM